LLQYGIHYILGWILSIRYFFNIKLTVVEARIQGGQGLPQDQGLHVRYKSTQPSPTS